MYRKIAFIATGYIVKYDGISVYTENLLDAFLERIADTCYPWHIDIYAGKQVVQLLEERVLERHRRSGPDLCLIAVDDGSFFHKMAGLYAELLKNGRYDAIFATNFMPLILPWTRMMKVIHDLSPETNPTLYSPFHRRYHALLLRSAKYLDRAIGYISRTTAADLRKYYGIVPDRKAMLYLPNGIPFKVRNYERPDPSQSEEKFTGRKLYLLVVGRLNRAKGVDRILDFYRFFDRFLSDRKRFDEVVLTFTGKQTEETTALFEDAAFERIRLRFDGFLDDEALNRRYRESHFTLFLSRNEGYGLPLVEALWFRSIPLLSDIAIFREIMGEGYPLFGEGTEEEMLQFILRHFDDAGYRAAQRAYLEEVTAHERDGYARAAQNLITWISADAK